MEHARNPVASALILVLCGAIGLFYAWLTIRARVKLRPPLWCLASYALGALLCVVGVAVGPPVHWLTVPGLGLVVLGCLLWRMLTPLPRDLVRIRVSDEGVRQVGLLGGRPVGSMRWTDLREVWVETDNVGPSFRLVGAEGELVVWGESVGASDLPERLRQLPGFCGRTYSEAMSATGAGRFCVWRHEPRGPARLSAR